jgi:hypothetical protein
MLSYYGNEGHRTHKASRNRLGAEHSKPHVSSETNNSHEPTKMYRGELSYWSHHWIRTFSASDSLQYSAVRRSVMHTRGCQIDGEGLGLYVELYPFGPRVMDGCSRFLQKRYRFLMLLRSWCDIRQGSRRGGLGGFIIEVE